MVILYKAYVLFGRLRGLNPLTKNLKAGQKRALITVETVGRYCLPSLAGHISYVRYSPFRVLPGRALASVRSGARM